MPLYDILNEFQKGNSHIAVVFKDLNETKEILKRTKEGEHLGTKHSCKEQRAEPEMTLKQGEDV